MHKIDRIEKEIRRTRIVDSPGTIVERSPYGTTVEPIVEKVPASVLPTWIA